MQEVCIISLLLANMDKITCWISNPRALANKQAPLPSTSPYFAPFPGQLMVIHCYCQLPVLPSAGGWIKAAQNKALARNCRVTWISLVMPLFPSQHQNNKQQALAAHNSGTSAVCIETGTTCYTLSQVVCKQQRKSQIPRDAALSYLHHWALVLTWKAKGELCSSFKAKNSVVFVTHYQKLTDAPLFFLLQCAQYSQNSTTLSQPLVSSSNNSSSEPVFFTT